MKEPLRAACAGQWRLFDSTWPDDHAAAAEFCKVCPVIAACDERLQEELALGRTLRTAGGGPRGTWAGRLIGAPRYLKDTA